MEEERTCIPKLAVLSRPWEWEMPEAQGMKTPPLMAPLSISIPFKWEETPGKPIHSPSPSPSPSLHLPPFRTRSSSLRLDFASLALISPTSTSTRTNAATGTGSSSSSSEWQDKEYTWAPTPSECGSFAKDRGRNKGIFIKMKRSSTFFATILNRIRSRIWLKKGR